MFRKLFRMGRKAMPAAALPLLILGACASTQAQNGNPAVEDTPAPAPTKANPWAKYAQVLPDVVASALPVDRKQGYLVKEVKPGVHVVTDGVWQSAFVVTGAGVIVIDAPEAYAAKLPEAIAKVTQEPIRMLVYSHAHKDHIGGSAVFSQTKDLKIVALESVKQFLEEKQDDNRLIPTTTFSGSKTITMGNKRIELRNPRNYHSNEGDLLVYIPQDRFLMAMDVLAPGYGPFMGFDLTSNFHEYIRIFDDLLELDFDVFVGGHLTQIGTREDVRLSRDFVRDVYETTKRVHGQTDLMAIMAETAEAAGGYDNKYLLFRAFLDRIVENASKEIVDRWGDKLASLDVFVESHVRVALVYVRWDD